MSDVVYVDTAAGPNYTWASASFTWGSAAAGKNWSTAYPAVYALGVAVALGLSESRVNQTVKGISEPVGFTDGAVKDLLLSRSETFSFSETYADLISFVLHFLEGLALADSEGKELDLQKGELLGWTDQLAQNASKSASEVFGVSDIRMLDSVKTLTEPVSFFEAASRSIQKDASEILGFSDGTRSQIEKTFFEALGFAETYTDLIEYLISVSESLAISSAPQKELTKPLSESFALIDARVNQLVKGIPEALAIGELLGRTVDYRRNLSEGLNLGDSIAKALAISLPEALAIADQYRRRANGVISDMVISRLAITEQDFRDILDAGHPPGYSNFRDFISGDYTYQRALFRAILETDNADRGYINGLRVTVDVPDVFDRGTAQISDASAGIYVAFTRTFHIAPEVTLTHKGGTVVATPKIIGSITKSGFTAVLETSAGTRVAGSFIWVAQGY